MFFIYYNGVLKVVFIQLLSFDLSVLSSDKVEATKAEQDTASKALSSDKVEDNFSWKFSVK